jgi:hypothetical protein
MTISEYNNSASDYVSQVNRTVVNDVLEVNNSIETTPHYTVVARLPQDLRNKINNIAKQLHEIDNSLTLTPSDLYHITILWTPLESNIKSIKTIILKELKATPLSFNIKGLIFGYRGIGVKVYSNSINYINIKRNFYKLTGKEFTGHEMDVSTWITIARYSRMLSNLNQLREHILSLEDKHFLDNYIPEQIECYISKNKVLEDPEKIFDIKNRLNL